MILRMLRGAFLLVSSVVVIPYTIAVVSNILHGWPQSKHKYKRALSPRKVYGLNYVLLQMLRDKLKYARLYLKWVKFYKTADPRFLYKNLAFGRNDCTLDVYLPNERDETARSPVVIFVYGGAWSSGNKKTYGLLCNSIVTDTQSVVVCPNYSCYPKGYVDDMIQDVVDSISWVIDNIHEYGGDKNKIILIGHSAGAHLATMAILELLHDERLSVQPSFKFEPAGAQLEQLAFADSHYGGMGASDLRHETHGDSSGSSESFAVVSENGAMGEQSGPGSLEMSGGSSLLSGSMNSEALESSANSEGFVSMGRSMVEESQAEKDMVEDEAEDKTPTEPDGQPIIEDPGAAGDSREREKSEEPSEDGDNGDSRSGGNSGSLGDDEEEHEDDSGDNDSVITVRPKDIERHATLVDICKSVKAFIGLAGVYSISDHFQHEFMRGVEDVSCMCRAHYGEDHFARFSPKEIIRSLGRRLSLPMMILAHGVEDYIVPLSATLTFADALAEISANVKVKVIPDCDHYEICLDLMDRQRKFYSHVMNIIMETINAVS